MAKLERMTVEVPEPLAERLRAAVDAGDYPSTNEAIGDAVRLWADDRRNRDEDRDRLRAAWDAGKASGLHGPIDFESLRHEARARLSRAMGDSDRDV